MGASLWAPEYTPDLPWQSITPRPLAVENSTPLSSQGSWASILTAYTGDLKGTIFPVSAQITGSDTLTKPPTGYVYQPGLYPETTYLFNSSGWNESLSSNVGRTAAVAKYIKVDQYGQGDAVGVHVNSVVVSARAGALKFLASPAGVCFNGQQDAFVDAAYLNAYETIQKDNGYDVAAIGIVNNFVRTNATGAKSTVWIGYRAQNTGTQPVNSIISAIGLFSNGLDLTMSGLNFGANKAAISMKADDRHYYNNNALASGNLDADWATTGYNGDYITYSSALSAINVVVGGGSRFQVSNAQVTANNAPFAVAGLTGGTSIIRGLQTGFGVPTGTTNTAAFDTATVTLTQLAQYVRGLVQRIHASTGGAHALLTT